MYAIIGTTGHVGGVVANTLLAHKLPVRAVVRNIAKAEEWKAKGAEIAIAELHDRYALELAFAGCDGVFIMTPPLFNSNDPMADHDQMLAALKGALKAAEPKKVVYLSSIGAQHATGTGAIKKLHDMEQAFADLPMPAASIRAAWFMENFAGAIAYARESGRLTSFLEHIGNPIPMIAARDIGTTAAKLLVNTWLGKRIIELEGPRRYAASDVAYTLSYQLKRDVVAEAIPPENYARTYQSFGFTQAAAELMAEMNRGFNNGHIVFEGGDTEHLQGSTFLEDVIKSYIE